MTILLQPLTESHLEAVVALDQQVFGGFWTAPSYQQELQRSSSDFYGLWVDATPSVQPRLLGMGCSWAIADEAHIILLAVHPQYRRLGFGYGLLLQLLDCAHGRALHYATLEVRASNLAAIALYTKLGFEVAGRRPRYYQDAREDAIILWRSGLQTPEFKTELNTHWEKVTQDWQRCGAVQGHDPDA